MFIKPFSEISRTDVEIAGGKGASLGEMTQAGIPVPSGFVVLSLAFDRFLEETDLNVEINAALDEVSPKVMHTIEEASEKIRAMMLAAEIPEDIKQEIKRGFDGLKDDVGDPELRLRQRRMRLWRKRVAVRSSATAEDGSSAAWAGQLETYLNTTEENLLENVRKCWASLFTPRAIFYRKELEEKSGGLPTPVSVAVVVQRMVQSEVSGVAFSVHPVTQDRGQITIEAGWGLGEAIVSGSITPDSYVVDKVGGRIMDANVSEQERMIGEHGWEKVPSEKRASQKLSNNQIVELSKLVVRIEHHYGFPVDVEWALKSGKFFITQSRPITTLIE